MALIGVIGHDVDTVVRAIKNMMTCHVVNMHANPNTTVSVLVVTAASPLLAQYVTRLTARDFLVINADDTDIFPYLEGCSARLLTYGLNSRSCVTASSITDNDLLVCLQRAFVSIDGTIREPQEYPIPLTMDCDPMLVLGAAAACAACGVARF